MLEKGTKVKVIKDYEAETSSEESEWIGATGIVKSFDGIAVVIKVLTGNPNLDDGDYAWFDESELETIPDA